MANNSEIKTSSFIGTRLTTTISITLVLFLLGVSIFIAFMGRDISIFIKENMSITIELSDKANQSSIDKLEQTLRESSFVKSITYLSKEDVKKELIQELGSNPEDLLGYIPASSYFDIKLKSDYTNKDSIIILEKQLANTTIIKSFLYNDATIQLINSNLNKLATGSLVIALILLFISFTLIKNTIRLNIYAKRFTINTMQLVGATNSFIRKPFILQAIFIGLLSAFLANVGITTLIYYLTKEFPELISIIQPQNLIILYILVFILGLVITLMGTITAVNKYLKLSTNRLYYV